MKEGKWQINVTMDMPGLPMKVPPVTYTQCLNRDNQVPRRPQSTAADCEEQDVRVEGDKVRWSMKCRDEAGVMIETRGEILYRGDTFAGEFTSVMNDPGQGRMEMHQRLTGTYMGPCTP
jgi:hypothetical protein